MSKILIIFCRKCRFNWKICHLVVKLFLYFSVKNHFTLVYFCGWGKEYTIVCSTLIHKYMNSLEGFSVTNSPAYYSKVYIMHYEFLLHFLKKRLLYFSVLKFLIKNEILIRAFFQNSLSFFPFHLINLKS